MVIQTDEMEKAGWRIAGTNLDWQIQCKKKRKDGYSYEGKRFYSSLEHAVEKAYELLLRDSKAAASDMRDALAECRRVKTQLVNEVRAAAGKADPC